MDYPLRLLPSIEYCLMLNNNILANHYFVRHTKNKDFFDSVTQKIKPDYITTQTINLCTTGISNNLLGIFKVQDTKFHFKRDGEYANYFKGNWELNSNVRLPTFMKDYFIDNERGRYFSFYVAIAWRSIIAYGGNR